MGKYDQPAVFKFVLEKTGVSNLTYIGHSQGTSQIMAALCSNLGFFKDKINLAILLAPVATVHNAGSKQLQDMARNSNAIALVEKMGPELVSDPGVGGKLTGGVMKILGQGTFALSMVTDSDMRLISQ